MADEDPRQAAIKLLSRREHSRRELERKLEDRGYDFNRVAVALDELEVERLLSDRRFAEAYARQRAVKGYGPARIRAELRERGVDERLIGEGLAETGAEIDWYRLATEVRHKRFGAEVPEGFKEKARQMRFLQYRGFDTGQIQAALDGDWE